MDQINKIKKLITLCNKYRDAYYNHQPLVPDDVYDRYFDELSRLEQETNCYFSNSPTQSVGYKVVDSLPKVIHDIPLLSLDKTKSVEDVVKFAGDKDVLVMIKGDGLTTKLVYKSNGEYAELVEASTRGNGEVGSLVTHNVKTFVNVPLKIKYHKDLTVVGESVIYKEDFDKINTTLPESEQYSNCRNLASGSLSLLDSRECAKRHMRFMLFDVIKGMDDINSLYKRFELAASLGFDVIYHQRIGGMGAEEFADIIKNIHEYADNHGIPCDGAVIRYDDYAYGLSLGRTGHHYRYGIAKKEEDDLVATIFRGIEWNTSRNGIVVPTGLFDEISILDSNVSRATLHNLNYIDGLKLRIGDRICCSKRNMVVPAIEVNLDYNPENYKLPLIDKCPSCGATLEIKNTGNANVLYCPNDNCPARNLAKFEHFVSKKAMDIQGLSEKTLELLISHGFLHNYKDIYHLKDHRDELILLDGLGEKSVDKLLDSIEKSRAVTLDRFITALGIPNIGSSAAKAISKQFNGDHYDFVQALSNGYDFSQIDDFGEITNKSLHDWWNSKNPMAELLPVEMNFVVENDVSSSSKLNGKSFCITGSLTHYQNRNALVKSIEDNGGKYVSGVSKKTDFLINNDTTSTSGKNKKAVELNIPIISEDDFLKMLSE